MQYKVYILKINIKIRSHSLQNSGKYFGRRLVYDTDSGCSNSLNCSENLLFDELQMDSVWAGRR